MPRFACACFAFVSQVPSTCPRRFVLCVCVCVILCHNVILISVYIISYDMHDVSRYVHRCRVARVVLGCFGKVI